jgi:predicted AlkP superfamily phosphohydrolase/phosphomutase
VAGVPPRTSPPRALAWRVRCHQASPRGASLERKAAVASTLIALAWATPAHAYIGPGAGFAVFGSFLVMLAAVLLGGLVLLTWPVRFLLRNRRRRRAYAKSQADRVVVLGLDGVDPEIAEAMMTAGRLPNLARLRENGAYGRLATTCPAMSPVAWSSFMTGAGPGRHGIFDFLHRDPRTYLPDLSSAQIRPPTRFLRIGRHRISVGRPTLRALRRSKPFWTVLGEHGVFSTILRVPITFPAEPFHGLLLSGMCVPDLRGTQGSFTFFSTTEPAGGGAVGGERIRLIRENGVVRGALPGPALAGSGGGQVAQAALVLRPIGSNAARLDIDGQSIPLQQGEYSDWAAVNFRLGPGMRASGICRWYLKQIEPEVELYATPINIDPEHPALPFSHPAIFATYLSKLHGRYATLGLAEDTWALNEGVLDEAAFMRQCQLIFEERERMLSRALRNTRHGCVVCVFDTTDRIQHMFWRYRDDGHPANRGKESEAFRQAVEDCYEQADAMVGRVAAGMTARDVLVVMSDHGFKAFRRGVNMNAWLRDNGHLSLKPGATGEVEWLRDVDWERTRAYAIGLGGVYLNIRGREAHGIVGKEEVAALKQELAERLTGLRDEATGEVAVSRVYDNAAVNPGPYADVGPDLTVGYAPGYRVSWDGAQGKVAGPAIEDNTRRWSGDHCVDPAEVPGVLFCNRRLDSSDAGIADLAPTILSLFGVKAPGYMEGRSLLPASEDAEHVDA